MKISLETIDQQASLEITSTISLLKVPTTLAQSWKKIKTHMKATKVGQVEKPYAKFIGLDWDDVANGGFLSQIKQILFGKQKIAVGIRVDSVTKSTDEIEAANLEAGEYVKATHIGGVHKVGASYKLMIKWAEQQDIQLESTSIEIYTHAPGDVETSKMETILLIRVKR